MHLTYIDDSGDEEIRILSALTILADEWNSCLKKIKEFRHQLKISDAIYVDTEFHAWKFVSGRGRISDDIVTKQRRCQIFKQTLEMTAMLPGARLFHTVFSTKASKLAFQALLSEINRSLQQWNSHAILICDEGGEDIYTRLVRRMQTSSSPPINRILEDPFFKQSNQSYFIQLSDFSAYALLRQEHPIESKTKYGLDRAFNLLKPISEGIIRPYL